MQESLSHELVQTPLSPAAFAPQDRRAWLCQTLVGEGKNLPWGALSLGQWNALVQLASQEGVAPLFHVALRQAEVSMPARPGQALLQAYYTSAAQNALFLQELDRIMATLNAARLPALALKGAVLAQVLYPAVALRPMGDLDILVRWQDREATLAVAASLGYLPAEPEMRPGLDAETMHTVFLLGGPDRRVGLELHWSLLAARADARSAPDAWLWQGALPLDAQRDFLQPAPGPHLLYLAAHLGLRHPGQPRLIWLYDLHLLLTAHAAALNWPAIVRQAQGLGWEAVLGTMLRQVQAAFGSPVPAEVLAALPDGAVPAQRPESSRTRTAQTWAAIRLLDGRTQVRLLLALAFPSPAYMRWRYPHLAGWPHPLLYPYRWADIVRDVGKTLFTRSGR